MGRCGSAQCAVGSESVGTRTIQMLPLPRPSTPTHPGGVWAALTVQSILRTCIPSTKYVVERSTSTTSNVRCEGASVPGRFGICSLFTSRSAKRTGGCNESMVLVLVLILPLSMLTCFAYARCPSNHEKDLGGSSLWGEIGDWRGSEVEDAACYTASPCEPNT
jgi:hypothetical protein